MEFPNLQYSIYSLKLKKWVSKENIKRFSKWMVGRNMMNTNMLNEVIIHKIKQNFCMLLIQLPTKWKL